MRTEEEGGTRYVLREEGRVKEVKTGKKVPVSVECR